MEDFTMFETFQLVEELESRGYVVISEDEGAQANSNARELESLHAFVGDLLRKARDLKGWRG